MHVITVTFRWWLGIAKKKRNPHQSRPQVCVTSAARAPFERTNVHARPRKQVGERHAGRSSLVAATAGLALFPFPFPCFGSCRAFSRVEEVHDSAFLLLHVPSPGAGRVVPIRYHSTDGGNACAFCVDPHVREMLLVSRYYGKAWSLIRVKH
ncbi:hypothetical protein HD806DRAFT_60377 [Xylariaceae sp. AK1471]|nr:hypothetical protein HD806DRAFT_60377 [Xylariaceae sp. AK1471]